jgi:glycosyltransferase involved in cell wall biosynthesis
MHILLTHVLIGRGGDAIQWSSLADAFRAAGHRVEVAGAHAIAPYRTVTAEARARGVGRRLPWWMRDLLEAALIPLAWSRAAWIARRCRPDVIVHRAATYDGTGVLLARTLRVPLVAFVDAHVPLERGFRGESYWAWLHRKSTAALGAAAACVVVPSEAVRDLCVALGVPPGRLVVEANGVAARHLRLGAEAARRSPPMAVPGRCTIGFVGSLSEWHRVDLLLEAASRLASRGDGIVYRLVIVGVGGTARELRRLAGRLGIEPLVEWRGALSHDAAVAAMEGFDVAVLPGTLPSGTPMKLAEYAAMGRPIVAPDLPNVRAMLPDGERAVLVAPGDPTALAEAVAALAASPDRARRLGEAARRWAQERTWEATAQRVVRAACDVAAPPARSAPAREGAAAALGGLGREP